MCTHTERRNTRTENKRARFIFCHHLFFAKFIQNIRFDVVVSAAFFRQYYTACAQTFTHTHTCQLFDWHTHLEVARCPQIVDRVLYMNFESTGGGCIDKRNPGHTQPRAYVCVSVCECVSHICSSNFGRA